MRFLNCRSLLRECRGRRTDLQIDLLQQVGGLGEALDRNTTGLIEASTGLLRHQHVSAIVRSFQQAKVLIVCQTLNKIDSYVEALSQTASIAVGKGRGLSWTATHRVMCITKPAFEHLAYPAEHHIVIFDNAKDAREQGQLETIFQMWRQRIYGFVEPGVLRQDPKLALELECCFGDVISTQGAVANKTTSVAFADYTCPQMRLPVKDHRKRFEALSRLKQRNDAAARVAKLLAAGDSDRLIEYGLGSTETWIRSSHRIRVALMVDRPDDASAMTERLPGWPAISASDVADDGSITHGGWGNGFVVTSVAAHRMQRLTATILVNLCGGDRGWVPDSFFATDQPLLVVDFNDHCHSGVQRASDRRKTNYLANGFVELGSPVPGPLIASMV